MKVKRIELKLRPSEVSQYFERQCLRGLLYDATVSEKVKSAFRNGEKLVENKGSKINILAESGERWELETLQMITDRGESIFRGEKKEEGSSGIDINVGGNEEGENGTAPVIELISCDKYKVCSVKVSGNMELETDAPFLNVTVVKGKGKVFGQEVKKGNFLLVTKEGTGKLELSGDMELIVSRV